MMLVRAATIALCAAATAFLPSLSPTTPPIRMVVYKDPSCGCCAKWVDHMRAAGFLVAVVDTADMGPVKTRYGVSDQLASCHTAQVGGYVIEGHVPADLVQRLLRDKPRVAGLAVPGMVAGSPGMESPRPQHYDVVSFDRTGKTQVYARR